MLDELVVALLESSYVYSGSLIPNKLESTGPNGTKLGNPQSTSHASKR